MSEFKGTKGRWEVTDPTNELKWVNINADDGLPHLRSFWGEGVTKEEAKANAQLISKAPEMLEMLNHILFTVFWNGSNLNLHNKEKIEQLIKEATTI